MNQIICKYFFISVLFLLISGCANQLPPGGGDIDRIPPTIEKVSPADGTVNFKDNYFELEFSEYVDKRSFKDAVFISPATEGNLEFDWSGRTVRVYFPDKLKDNITYVVTIGTDVVDLNNHNRMAQSLNFSFSTGSNIDKRVVKGKVYTDKPSGILIYAYNTARTPPEPLKNKPDYISQTGTDGAYRLAGLSAGKYRIFAVRDEYRDLLFQPEQDKIGLPSSDIVLSETDSLYEGMDFYLTEMDTSSPRLLSATMTDKNHVLVSFSEPIDSTLIRASNFYIVDSTDNRKTGFVYAFKGNTKINEAVVVTKENYNEKNNLFFFADSIRDKAGNRYQKDFVPLVQSARPDTSKPDIFKSIPQNGAQDVDFIGSTFSFYINDGVDIKNISKALTFKDTLGHDISYSFKAIDDASFTVTPQSLEAQKDYVIRINMKLLPDAAGNKRDSVYVFKYRTISGLDFTGLNGVLSNSAGKNIIIILQSVDQKNIYAQHVLNSRFEFTRVIAGKYILWAFNDTDSNGVFSKGSLEPFKYSETFTYYPDSLILRPRWIQTDFQFNFNKR